MRTTALALLLLCTPAVAGDVFKCTIGGKAVYQGHPCTGVSRAKDQANLKPLAGGMDYSSSRSDLLPLIMGPKADSAQNPTEPHYTPPRIETPTSSQIFAATSNNQVIRGLTPEEVLRACQPHCVYDSSNNVDAYGPYEVWQFSERPGQFPAQVKFRNGVVESSGNVDQFGLPFRRARRR